MGSGAKLCRAAAASAATLGAAEVAAAQDAGVATHTYYDVGAFLSYTFGARDGFGFGLHSHLGEASLSRGSGCGPVDGNTGGYFGGLLRLSLTGVGRPMLLIGVEGGAIASVFASGGAELGATYALSGEDGVTLHTGLDLRYSVLETFLEYRPLWGDASAALGARVPPLVKSTDRICYVVGRPLHDDAGGVSFPACAFEDAAPAAEANSATTALPSANTAARVWARRAATEYASVSAFVQLARQLKVVGAPPWLQRSAFSAAADELRHAIDSGAIAAGLSGRKLSVAGGRHHLRSPATGRDALLRLALEAWVDGCLGEGVAAEVAAAEARCAQSPAIAAVQLRIAHEEAKHAELGWEVLQWCLREGGDRVRDALLAARDAEFTGEQADAGSEDLRAYGCLPDDARRETLARHRRAAQAELARLTC